MKTIKASDCKCEVCGKKAVAFWPVLDPDIISHPFCRPCLEEMKLKVMIKLTMPVPKKKKK